MFQNLIGAVGLPPPLLPPLLPPGLQAARSVAAATPPAPASRVRRVKPAPECCEAITGSSPMAAPLPDHRIRRRIESFEGAGRERPWSSSCVPSLGRPPPPVNEGHAPKGCDSGTDRQLRAPGSPGFPRHSRSPRFESFEDRRDVLSVAARSAGAVSVLR